MFGLTIAIMHTPGKRRACLRALRAAVPSAHVVCDEGRGVWDTARRAWLAHTPSMTHHLVLQDDIQLCERFIELAMMAIEQRPFVPISFFTPSPPSLTAQATCLPVPMIAAWLAWCEARPTLPAHDDVRLSKWMRAQGVRLSHVRPSLVQHGHEPSLLGHSTASAGDFTMTPKEVSWAT